MNVRNYRARTAEECIQKLKLDLGRDAVILQSRTLPRPVFGMFGPVMHEIVAVSDGNTLLDTLGRRAAARDAERDSAVMPPPRLSMTSGPAAARSPLRPTGRLTLAEAATLAESSAEGREAALAMIAEAAGLRSGDDDRVARIERQVAVLAEAISPPKPSLRVVGEPDTVSQPRDDSGAVRESAAGVKTSPFLRYRIPATASDRNVAQPQSAAVPEHRTATERDPYQSVFDQLRKARVAEALVRRFRADVPDGLSEDEARSALHDVLVGRLLTAGAICPSPGKMTVAALVGPTGVGKTTTAAKLAASLSLAPGGIKVGMISLDTQRVAGTAQLQTYAEILGVPVHVAYDGADLEKTLVELRARQTDVVLIDTPGCGPSESLSITEMSESLQSVVNLSTYLVLPATLSASNFDHTILRFSKMAAPTAMILSKLDETADNHCLGFLMNSQVKYRVPLAYVTTGARVPDDLLLADAHALIAKILAPSVA